MQITPWAKALLDQFSRVIKPREQIVMGLESRAKIRKLALAYGMPEAIIEEIWWEYETRVAGFKKNPECTARALFMAGFVIGWHERDWRKPEQLPLSAELRTGAREPGEEG